MSEEQIWPGRWGQERRLEFIDFRLLWDGRVNRLDLTNYFGISVPQASLDLAKYRELAPQNAVYDVTLKTYVAAEAFAPRFARYSADAYLSRVLAIEAGILEPDSAFLGWHPAVGVVRDPSREVDPAVLRSVLSAIRESRSLEADYQSMTNPDPKRRRIAPHAIAFDGSRWHARAYCHTHRDFRDFVLARLSKTRLVDKSPADTSQDTEWNMELEVVLAPHPGLSAGQKRAIEVDYNMENGQLVLRTREALLFYLLRHLGLLPKSTRGVLSDQVILDNQKELEPFFKKHEIALT